MESVIGKADGVAFQYFTFVARSGGTISKCFGKIGVWNEISIDQARAESVGGTRDSYRMGRTYAGSAELTLPDPNDATIQRCFRRVPEFGGRVLRVTVNRTVEPKRVVSVFFDRKMKGKL